MVYTGPASVKLIAAEFGLEKVIKKKMIWNNCNKKALPNFSALPMIESPLAIHSIVGIHFSNAISVLNPCGIFFVSA